MIGTELVDRNWWLPWERKQTSFLSRSANPEYFPKWAVWVQNISFGPPTHKRVHCCTYVGVIVVWWLCVPGGIHDTVMETHRGETQKKKHTLIYNFTFLRSGNANLTKCTKHFTLDIEGFLLFLCRFQILYLTEALIQDCEHPSCYEAFSQHLWAANMQSTLAQMQICYSLHISYYPNCNCFDMYLCQARKYPPAFFNYVFIVYNKALQRFGEKVINKRKKKGGPSLYICPSLDQASLHYRITERFVGKDLKII